MYKYIGGDLLSTHVVTGAEKSLDLGSAGWRSRTEGDVIQSELEGLRMWD